MKDLNLIFMVDNNWNIGINGDMLYKTKKDLDHFKRITDGNVMVMGRRTLEALPGKKGLVGRTNIVLSRDENYKAEDIILVHSIEELEKTLENYKDQKVFLIGGENLVRQLFDYCTYAYITKLDFAFENYDTSLPNLDQMEDWKIVKEEEGFNDGNYSFRFLEYERIKSEK